MELEDASVLGADSYRTAPVGGGRWNSGRAVGGATGRCRCSTLAGWRLLRFGSYEAALGVLVSILAEREHVASMRDGAECLYRLGRTGEALELLERAKKIESDNPYTLDLEARIYEENGAFEKAEAAARVAVIRNPSSWSLRHRLARILDALGRQAEAVGRRGSR